MKILTLETLKVVRYLYKQDNYCIQALKMMRNRLKAEKLIGGFRIKYVRDVSGVIKLRNF